MIIFVLAHEYGHILMGHLSGHGSGANAVIGGKRVNRIPHEWKQELEADAVAIQISWMVQRERANLPVILQSADFFFHCVDIAERAASVIATGKGPTTVALTDHPPTDVRRTHIRSALRNALIQIDSKGFSQNRWDADVKDAAGLSRAVEQLFQMTEPRLKGLYRRGIGLAPRWQRQAAK